MTSSPSFENDFGAWERHPRFSMADWAQQVTNNETDAGYAAYVVGACEAMGEPIPLAFLDRAQDERNLLAAQDACLSDAECDDLDRDYPRQDWQYEVENEDTRIGFRLWQINQCEANRV